MGFEYKVVVGLYPGRIFKRGLEYIIIDISVMNLIAQLENSTVRQVEFKIGENPAWGKIVARLLENGSADLSVLLGLKFPVHPMVRFVNTYDENAYCALVPLPPRLTFLGFILTPFDVLVWIFILVAVASATFVWQRLTKSFGSAIGFLFFVIGGFFGKFVALKVERKLLDVIVQLFVLMTLIVLMTTLISKPLMNSSTQTCL